MSKKSGVCCFLLSFFDFYLGVFGALPPFPTSFLDPKKEAKKEVAASPHSVFLKSVVFRQSAAAAPLSVFLLSFLIFISVYSGLCPEPHFLFGSQKGSEKRIGCAARSKQRYPLSVSFTRPNIRPQNRKRSHHA